LCEGGPTLNSSLLSAGVVDELCMTLAPTLVGGDGPRIVRRLQANRDLVLRGVLEQDGELYLRFEVTRT
ncbi:MAG: dihydrofolate reductase family protein, partial [Egibacteraceae bacterium]